MSRLRGRVRERANLATGDVASGPLRRLRGRVRERVNLASGDAR
jgi:hypothetical protein